MRTTVCWWTLISCMSGMFPRSLSKLRETESWPTLNGSCQGQFSTGGTFILDKCSSAEGFPYSRLKIGGALWIFRRRIFLSNEPTIQRPWIAFDVPSNGRSEMRLCEGRNPGIAVLFAGGAGSVLSAIRRPRETLNSSWSRSVFTVWFFAAAHVSRPRFRQMHGFVIEN